jgi:ABC-type lipoprotein release transport system permease subunit
MVHTIDTVLMVAMVGAVMVVVMVAMAGVMVHTIDTVVATGDMVVVGMADRVWRDLWARWDLRIRKAY